MVKEKTNNIPHTEILAKKSETSMTCTIEKSN